MSSKQSFLGKFEKALKAVAKDLGVDPIDVTRAEFMNSESHDITHWQLKKRGSFNALVEMLFPEKRDAVTKAVIRNTRSYKNKIERELGNQAFYAEQIQTAIKEVISKTPPRLHKQRKTTKSAAKKSSSRTLVAHLSDTHYGSNIVRDEIGNINEYNWTIAARRTALFTDQIAKYKPQYRKDTDLVLVFNGDMIAGVIHDQEWFADLMSVQFAGALDIMAQMVSYLSNEFKSVKVYCNTGNHGRRMHKGNKGRQTNQKWDSHEGDIYYALKLYIEGTCKNAEVIIPQTPYSLFQIQGHMVFASHGDTVINVGNPGSSINVQSISNQINKINAGLGETIKDEANIVMVGHVHTNTAQLMDNGVHLLVNGCLSGVDPFANSIGIFQSNPSQQIFEVTPEHAVGDLRMIKVREADDMKELDNIIKPFKSPLELK